MFPYLVVNNSQLLSYQWNSCWKHLSEISLWLATTFDIYLLFKFQNMFLETHVLKVTQKNQFLWKVKKTDLQKKKEKNWTHTFNLSIVLRSFVYIHEDNFLRTWVCILTKTYEKAKSKLKLANLH